MTDRVCSSVSSQAYSRPCRETYSCSTKQRRCRAQVQPAFLRPRRALWEGKAPSRLHCQADDSDEKKLDLLRQEETSDGAILFVFGDAEEESELEGVTKSETKTKKSEERSPEPEVAPKQTKKKAEKQAPPKPEAVQRQTKKKAEKKSPSKSEAAVPKEAKKADEEQAPKSEASSPQRTEKRVPKSDAASPQKTEKRVPKPDAAPPKKTKKRVPEVEVVAPHQTKAKSKSPPRTYVIKEPSKKASGSTADLKVTSKQADQEESTPLGAEPHEQNTEEPSSHLSNNLSETLADMTVVELKKKCKDVGMKGYSRLKKGELIDALQDRIQQGPSETAVL